MYDTGKVLIGVLVFLAAFTSPFWLNLASGKGAAAPELEYPKDAENCIFETEYINSYHMDILNEWRDKVVREDIRFTKIDGEKYEMSLSHTCMTCHDNKANFCDRCHDYLDVNPYCWNCHVAPELNEVEDPYDIQSIIKDFKKVHECGKPCNSKELEECCDSLKKECCDNINTHSCNDLVKECSKEVLNQCCDRINIKCTDKEGSRDE